MVENGMGQVVVITGASSGIGRATAHEFARQGARIVLAARNEQALQEVAAEVRELGGVAHVVVTDVGRAALVENLAQEAVERFGHVDAWVNGAAIMLYATIEETTLDEFERLMDVNYMGQVRSVKAALPVMKQQGHGTIINVGSVESHRAMPYQGAYTASKHAVKAFTDALRMEMQLEQTGIEVVGVYPASVNTPLFTNARSKFGVKPRSPRPWYRPETVAKAIVSAAERPQRDVYIGSSSVMLRGIGFLSPKLADWFMRRNLFLTGMMTDQPDDGVDNLDAPLDRDYRVHGEWVEADRHSLYTLLFERSPRWARFAVPAAAAAVAGVMLARRR